LKIYFDIDVIGGQIFGMTYATLELMKSFKASNEVINFVAGRKRNLIGHAEIMANYSFGVSVCPFPKKILKLSNMLGFAVENKFLGDYDYFIQVGLHQKRNIPKEKYVLFVHDTVGMRYPDLEAPFPDNAQQIIDSACLILTVSEFSRVEICHYFDVDFDKVEVVPNGCDFSRFKSYEKEELDKIRKKYSLEKPYLVCYGGKSPRKNIDFLIEGYKKLDIKNKPELVLFGQKINHENDVCGLRSLGYLSDDEVPKVLAGAMGMVFPSYYEGFGLPILEAFSCGVPVICSNQASLPEVSQGNAVYFDPFDVDDLIQKINLFVSDQKLRSDLVENGYKLVGDFSWQKMAGKLFDVLNDKKEET